MTAITIQKSGRVIDSPDDFTYDCQNLNCANTNSRTHLGETGIDLPDSEFPQKAEVKEYGLDPEICLECQGVQLI
jgi:hypothetical protein